MGEQVQRTDEVLSIEQLMKNQLLFKPSGRALDPFKGLSIHGNSSLALPELPCKSARIRGKMWKIDATGEAHDFP